MRISVSLCQLILPVFVPVMLQIYLISVFIFFTVLSFECACQSPITWPDPRHFTAKIDPTKGNKVDVSWPVAEYCPQNSVKVFTVNISKIDDAKFNKTVEFHGESGSITLEEIPADYVITAAMITKFKTHTPIAQAHITTRHSK